MLQSKAGRRVLVAALIIAGPAIAKQWQDWGPAHNIEELAGTSPDINTSANDGCPIESPDGLSLFFASNRSVAGAQGGQDIWVAHRQSRDDGWGPPEDLGPEVNSGFDDFCPDPAPGNRLFFVSRRDDPAGDIYMTQLVNGHWRTPVNLGPNINSTAQEWSPSYFEDEQGRGILYFSTTRNGGLQDIYASIDMAPAVPVAELNTAQDDSRPNVSKDGLEVVFDSNRPGTFGGPDIWTASRASTDEPWGNLTHLPADINTGFSETRATFSRDGSRILFGSNRLTGTTAGDIFYTEREKQTGSGK